MPANERLFNTVIGLNILAWAALGIGTAEPAERFSTARICVTLLNAVVGCLFLLRAPLRRSGSLADCAIALPSLIVGGMAFRLSFPLQAWPVYAQALFIAGTVITIGSLLNLGRSFALLPARRGIVRHGAYRIIRHPVYFGELTLMAAMFLAVGSWWTAIPLALAIPAVAIRILAEEHLLRKNAAYLQYTAEVNWRLLPGVW